MAKSSVKIKELEDEVRRLREAVEELKVLNEIAVAARKATDIDQMLNIIVQKSIVALNAEQGSILLVTQNENDPFTTYIRQDDTSKLRHKYHIGSNITGWVLLNKEPLVIENLATDKRFHASEDEKNEIHSVLCVPMWFEGKIMGLMIVVNKKDKMHFEENDLTLLSIISVQASQLIKNLQLQEETFQKRKETEKLLELDRIKTDFFTNISHEFRTPLTLIIGPLEKLMDNDQVESVQREYNLIHKNAKKLLSLINQLLDLSSIDAGKMKLEVENFDFINFIKGILASFQSLAENKHIKLEFHSDKENLELYIDKDKMEKIINNLLSNALKFSGENGHISVSVFKKDSKVEISVEDDGIGIAEQDIKNIFNRFYKAKSSSIQEGTGIGLALVKELVEMHYGTITVKSRINEGTQFHIEIPQQEALYKKFLVSSKPEVEIKPKPTRQKIEEEEKIENEINIDTPRILIVEDNKDLLNFINENINKQYTVYKSSDGKQGLQKALEIIPDLIISDIKMPEMDGIELCEKIKADERTNHIPVILLTARSTLENKMEGLETGADDYITKPFKVQELRVRVNNLIEQRKKLREQFRKEFLLEPKDIKVASADEKFLNRILEILEQNYANENFTSDEFSKKAGLSRMQLHRKLHALTDQSSSEFIRNFRLKRALKLLSAKKGNISEIAFEVGFSNPSYFTECFKGLFGFSPSEYQTNSNKIINNNLSSK
ncbi:MAG: ATP-binding protein [Ignavibacteriaceae bacterium]